MKTIIATVVLMLGLTVPAFATDCQVQAVRAFSHVQPVQTVVEFVEVPNVQFLNVGYGRQAVVVQRVVEVQKVQKVKQRQRLVRQRTVIRGH